MAEPSDGSTSRTRGVAVVAAAVGLAVIMSLGVAYVVSPGGAPQSPNHESWLPNLIKANDLFGKFRKLMDQTPNLDMDKEISNLQSQLDAIFKEAPASPTK